MGALVPFAYGDSLVRVVEIEHEPWWIAGDVARVLGFSHTPHMLRSLDDDEAAVHIVDSRSSNGVVQKREVTVISESGIYHAIFASRRAEAKHFRKWVTSVVLPAIRRQGFYALAHPDPRADEIEDLRRRPVGERAAERRDLAVAVMAFVDDAIAIGACKSAAVAEAAEIFDVSRATVWNWERSVRAVPDADRPVALTPQFTGGGRRSDIPPEAWSLFCEMIRRPGAKVGTSYRRLGRLAGARGWGNLPSELTFRRRLAALRAIPHISETDETQL